jgi:hypothetical protein
LVLFVAIELNLTSKILQKATLHIDLAIVHLKKVLLSLEEYEGSRLTNSLARAKEIACNLNI